MNALAARHSLWLHRAAPVSYPAQSGDLRTQVLVAGAGITGLLTAARLADGGLDVVVIDAGRIAARNTGLSTGNLYAPVSGMADLVGRWGVEVASQVVRLRAQAVHAIEALVDRFALECDFARVPMQYGVQGHERSAIAQFERELQAYARVGLACLHRQSGLPFALAHAFSIPQQAQLDPAAFCRGLAGQLSGRVRLFEHTTLLDLDASAGVATTTGGRVRADHFVLATHSPAGFNLVQAEMEAYREHAFAAPVVAPPEPGIHWIGDQRRSLRAAKDSDGQPWLVLVGESHRAGEAPARDPQRQLADEACRHFTLAGASLSWSAQQFRSADRLPFIGGSAHDNVWVATGFGADGLTWAGVAAQVISEAIQGVESDAARLFSPLRFTPMRSAAGWARCNATVARHMLGDRLASLPAGAGNIAQGSGAIVEHGGQRCAVYRDEEGRLHVMSAVCPHLKCLVQWNGLEKSWDCPCHGSRFSATGALLEGPARTGLAPHRP
ncbi:[Fe-S]-binding protein [Stenotrophomonas maltophilia]|uniref:[Fe-S]-binding protein n=1 Tax=Stenotrophomonas maltophilia TaxID=40324 RepID=A0A1A6XZT0_STEMA|nr:FAD-dependent oxidoreductase [Stenotrophomonas maltophilia]OBU68473.1 [Fe-S]-binding protein [Stenotrophomonas maltophilia]